MAIQYRRCIDKIVPGRKWRWTWYAKTIIMPTPPPLVPRLGNNMSGHAKQVPGFTLYWYGIWAKWVLSGDDISTFRRCSQLVIILYFCLLSGDLDHNIMTTYNCIMSIYSSDAAILSLKHCSKYKQKNEWYRFVKL